MTILYQISQLGQPVLREKTKPVKNPKSKAIQNLIRGMIATCDDVPGVGLAAPQVYESLQLFIMSWKEDKNVSEAPTVPPFAVINPKIISKSKKIIRDWEGCLSVPGIRALVPRSASIKVSYTNSKGKIERKSFDGILARIFQHEFDHLYGIIFIDRAKTRDIVTDKEYRRILREKKLKK